MSLDVQSFRRAVSEELYGHMNKTTSHLLLARTWEIPPKSTERIILEFRLKARHRRAPVS